MTRGSFNRFNVLGDRDGRTDDEHDERINVMTRRVYTCVFIRRWYQPSQYSPLSVDFHFHEEGHRFLGGPFLEFDCYLFEDVCV